MKATTLIFIYIFSLTASAFANFEKPHEIMDESVVISHKILPGQYHKSGSMHIYKDNLSSKEFQAIFKYNIKTRLFVPLPSKYKTGQHKISLPIEFATEEGYLMLESAGVLENKEAKLIYLGKESVLGFQETHKIKVIPASGKWVGTIWYHPTVASVGWVKFKLTIKKVKFVGKYTIVSQLK